MVVWLRCLAIPQDSNLVSLTPFFLLYHKKKIFKVLKIYIIMEKEEKIMSKTLRICCYIWVYIYLIHVFYLGRQFFDTIDIIVWVKALYIYYMIIEVVLGVLIDNITRGEKKSLISFYIIEIANFIIGIGWKTNLLFVLSPIVACGIMTILLLFKNSQGKNGFEAMGFTATT